MHQKGMKKEFKDVKNALLALFTDFDSHIVFQLSEIKSIPW